MDTNAQTLLDQIQTDQRRTSDRMHRDARRQHALKHASLMLGQGHRAEEVRLWLSQQALVLTAVAKKEMRHDD